MQPFAALAAVVLVGCGDPGRGVHGGVPGGGAPLPTFSWDAAAMDLPPDTTGLLGSRWGRAHLTVTTYGTRIDASTVQVVFPSDLNASGRPFGAYVDWSSMALGGDPCVGGTCTFPVDFMCATTTPYSSAAYAVWPDFVQVHAASPPIVLNCH